MSQYPRVGEDGSLIISGRLTILPSEIAISVTTSGGPGGQHANRSLTKVIATFFVDQSVSLSPSDQALLVDRLGSLVRASASRFRSQSQNRQAALESLADKLTRGLHREPPRRATKATRASKVRRVDEKKRRGQAKQLRRRPLDD